VQGWRLYDPDLAGADRLRCACASGGHHLDLAAPVQIVGGLDRHMGAGSTEWMMFRNAGLRHCPRDVLQRSGLLRSSFSGGPRDLGELGLAGGPNSPRSRAGRRTAADKLRETGKSPRVALTVIVLSHPVVTHLEFREANRLPLRSAAPKAVQAVRGISPTMSFASRCGLRVMQQHAS
jgi:hypothetical protein